MRIICLDDHPTMLDSLVRELNIIVPGAVICAFQDANTALEYAEENGCDVLFCEIDLYGKDGVFFAEKMQAINPRVNIIFTTVCAEAERAKEVFRLHPSGYITKPYTQEQLARELNNLRYPVRMAYAPVYGGMAAGYAPYQGNAAAYGAQPEPAGAYIPPREPVPTPHEPAAAARTPISVPREQTAVPREPVAAPPAKEKLVTAPASEAEKKEPAMSSRDLRRLSRSELLEMLIAQTKETEKLKVRLEEAEQKLANKTLVIEKAGSIAQASLQLNGVFEAAQKAADQYLDSVRTQTKQIASREKEVVVRAERLLNETRSKCAALESETARKCEEMTRNAEAETALRWRELQGRMDAYLREHEELRSLLGSVYK